MRNRCNSEFEEKTLASRYLVALEQLRDTGDELILYKGFAKVLSLEEILAQLSET